HTIARWSWFAFIHRQPMIFADMLACVLLCAIWKDRLPRVAAVLYAISPLAILLSGFHGNTDPIYVMLCLAAAVLVCAKRAFLLAGLTLGLAINVKFIPVLFIPAFAAICRERRQLMSFVIGLAVMGIPFLPLLLLAPGALIHNVISYRSVLDYWGINQ